jgi:hypothetical protein
MSLKFSEKTVNVDEKMLYGSISELENAVLALFWVGEKPKLGGLSITLPDRSSSQLLGNRDEMLSRMIGERIASDYEKMALVSTNLPMGFDGKTVLGLLNELLNDGKE